MAILVFTDCYVLINAVNISDHVKSATLSYSAAMLDGTAMTLTTKKNVAGLLEWGLEVEVLNDYAVSSIDATMFALVGAAAFAVEVRPTSGARSTSNPGYTGTGVLASYDPISAKIGDLATAKISIKSSTLLVRNTA